MWSIEKEEWIYTWKVTNTQSDIIDKRKFLQNLLTRASNKHQTDSSNSVAWLAEITASQKTSQGDITAGSLQ